MRSDNEEAMRIIATEVLNMFQKCLESASFDMTKRGFVAASLGNNKYTVKIEGAAYTVPSAISATINVNDTVLVLYEQGDPKRKSIIGKVVS